MATAKNIVLSNVLAIRNIASEAIDLKREIDKLEVQLDPLKDELRDFANGETETIEVPGKGKVSISKPSAPKSEPVLVADYEKFKQLPSKLQRDLLAAGWLSVSTKSSKGSPARVTISPNV